MARHSRARVDRFGFDFHVLIIGLILLILGTPQTMKAASALRVGENGRYLVEPDGKPLFWLGDTAWLLSQMTTREDMDLYLRTRALQGFTVIQAGVVMGEERVGGTLRANIYGDIAFANGDPAQPLTTPGRDPEEAQQYDYWDHMDYFVGRAGVYVVNKNETRRSLS